MSEQTNKFTGLTIESFQEEDVLQKRHYGKNGLKFDKEDVLKEKPYSVLDIIDYQHEGYGVRYLLNIGYLPHEIHINYSSDYQTGLPDITTRRNNESKGWEVKIISKRGGIIFTQYQFMYMSADTNILIFKRDDMVPVDIIKFEYILNDRYHEYKCDVHFRISISMAKKLSEHLREMTNVPILEVPHIL